MSRVTKLKEHVPVPLWDFACRIFYSISDLFKSAQPQESLIPYCGYKLFFGRESDIAKRLDKNGRFEDEMCTKIARELNEKPNPIFLDVGANIGLVSLSIASRCPTAKIYAFEPGESQQKFLEKNVLSNGLADRIVVNCFAAGEKDGKAQFSSHHPDFGSNDGFFDTHRAGRSFSTKTVEVEVKKLDTWWNEKGRPQVDVIKIDTEGAELLVLRGASRLIERCHPVLFLEISPLNLKVYPYTHFDILKFLENNSYSLYTLGDQPISRNNFDSILARGEVSFWAKSA